MRKARAVLALSLIAGVAVPALGAGAAAAAGGARKHRASSKTSSKHAAKTKFQPHQRAIDDARATEIQQALVRAGYLTGSPSGHWDAATIAAMTKLQSANGWQTKLVPDSRALIKLGLGPSAATPEPGQTTPATDTASLGSSRTMASAQ
jgi:hypothetical protein